MKFGVHSPSWVYGPDPTKAFERIKAKAQWAENHGFVWFSVMDHLIQIGGVGAPTEPSMEGWTALSALAAVTSGIRLATLASSFAYRNPAHLARIAAGVDQSSGGRMSASAPAGSALRSARADQAIIAAVQAQAPPFCLVLGR